MGIPLSVASVAGVAVGSSALGGFLFNRNQKQKTLSNVSVSDVQNTYATSILNNIQNCGPLPSEMNVLQIWGNFNNTEWVTQVINDNSQLNCTFQANNQQAIQDNLVAELTAQAEANAQAPLDVDFLGGLFGLHGGSLLNEANVDVSQVQSAVATVITNQVQNCAASSKCTGGNCSPGSKCSPPNSPSGCQGMCYGSPSTQPCGPTNSCSTNYANAICIDGNFNNVSNVSQTINADWVRNCFYTEQTNQNITNSLSSQINAIANATTTQTFTIFGWLIYLAVFFIIIGALFLGGRFLYRKYKQSQGQPAQIKQ